MKTNTRIVIVDNNEQCSAKTKLILESIDNFVVVNNYSFYDNAIRNIKKDFPDLFIVENEVPGNLSVIDGNKYIKSKKINLEIIMNSYNVERDSLVSLLKSGAIGFILKSDSILEQVSLFKSYCKGGYPLSSRAAKLLVQNFHYDVDSPLTDREREVLGLVSEGLSYSEVAEELYISKQTSKTHIKNIYAKLNVNNKSDAIRVAKENSFF